MINLNLKRKLLIKVSLLHTYYSSGTSNLFWLKPDGETLAFLQRFKLACKNGSSGIEIYADAFDCSTFQNYLSQNLDINLKFKLEALNNRIFQITKDLKNYEGKKMHIQNIGKKANEKVTFSDQQYVDIKDSHDNGKIERAKNIPLGDIEFQVTSPLQKHLTKSLGSKEKQEPVLFEIQFDAASSVWQYYLIKRNPKSEYNPVLKSIKKKIKFKASKKVQIENKDAYLIETSEPYQLSEIRDFRIELLDEIKKTERTFTKTLIKNVPIPLEYSHVSKERSTYISNIFINI